MTRSHLTAAVLKLGARFLDTFQVRRCWTKIDSAVNLGEMPSSEFVQSVLWVIRLLKTVELSCCAVATLWHWREMSDERCAHHIQFEFWLLWRCPSYDASRPFWRCRLLCSCSNASAAQRLLIAASYICLVTFSVLYYVTDFFFLIVPLSIFLDTVLSHNYHIIPVITH